MTTPSPHVDLKNPFIAAILAFLLPGAGHLYQRRFFKAFVFAICVWGSWWTGMAMSDWKALHAPELDNARIASTLKFAGQAGVGTPAVWALYQSTRFYSSENKIPSTIPGTQEHSFTGEVNLNGPTGIKSGDITGQLSLSPAQGAFGPAISGQLTGTLNGENVTLLLDKNVSLDQPVRSNRSVPVTASVVSQDGKYLGQLNGYIPRPFLNWFACPLNVEEEANWHRERGKYQELAMVFVWVAGLMNLLAIWDAFEGPAYGYDDESENKNPTPATT